MKLAVAQFNPTVGDLQGNVRLIVEYARQAYAAGVRMVITPELAVCGYMPEDLLLRPAFMQACQTAVTDIAQALADLTDLYLVLGHPAGTSQETRPVEQQGHSIAAPHRQNAASVINVGKILATYAKHLLPNYQVFDEQRYFAAGNTPVVFEVQGVKYGLLVCEDMWFDTPAEQAVAAGAQVLLMPNASPYHINKQQEREQRVAELARKMRVPMVYAHLVGGQDELVFDGGSFAMNANGQLAARAKQLAPDLLLLELNQCASPSTNEPLCFSQGVMTPLFDENEALWHTLVVGLRDYIEKNGFSQVVLGLSGGIDSALVMAIAADAIGVERIHAVMMPSPYTADISCTDASEMAKNLNVRYDVIRINDAFDVLRNALNPLFAGLPEDTTEENIQARIRGTLLMAISNKTGALVLTTGNKSELATGYCTLYGDMAGGFAVIKDLVKTRVYQLARWRNAHNPYDKAHAPIPQRIITRPPSAELRPDQTDQDSLPPYDVLDAIIERYVEKDQSIEDIVSCGFARQDVEKVARLIKLNEYKRRQAPIGIRLTRRAFGRDWRYPITCKFLS